MPANVEIERKFLLAGDCWRKSVERSVPYRQGYLAANEQVSVRVRIGADTARLNIKGATRSVSRREFEYEVPVADAQVLLGELCAGPLVEKVRHLVHFGGKLWEIDEFAGSNAGLIVAEIELDDEREVFEQPPWLGPEVSHDARFFNASLADRPFAGWPEADRAAVLNAAGNA